MKPKRLIIVSVRLSAGSLFLHTSPEIERVVGHAIRDTVHERLLSFREVII